MTTLWILNLCLIALDIALRFWWPQALPFLSVDPRASVPSLTVIIFGISALLFSLALWLSKPLLSEVSRSAWKGWNFDAALEEKEQSQSLFGFGRTSLTDRKKSAVMIFDGRDTTAAVAFSLVLIIVAVIGVIAWINYEIDSVNSWLVILTTIALLAAVVSLGYAIHSIGRHPKGNTPAPAWLPVAVAVLAAPFLLCLLGVADGFLAALSLHADQFPPVGFEAITYIVIRSVFLGVCTFCLAFAPKKIVELAIQKQSANKFFLSIITLSYAVWLTADWILRIYK